MAAFNQVILLGNVTRDPQLKQLPSNTAVAEFGMAVNRKYRTADGEEREDVTFVDLAAFGKQAEIISQYVQKGKSLFVQGRLKYDTWEDKQSGAKRSKLSVVVENFQFTGSRDGAAYQGSDEGEEPPARAPNRFGPGAPASNAYKEAKAGKVGLPDVQGAAPTRKHFKESDIPF